MRTDYFLDTNILVYAADKQDVRSKTASGIVAEGGTISVQVLHEFTAVARRKLRWGWPEISAALTSLRRLCAPPVPVDLQIHEHALKIAARDGLHIYDSLLLAAALRAKCTTFLSEDMQHGRVVENCLTIVNPFA